MLIHGYIASRYHTSIEPIKKAYLTAGNVNLMIVDWSQASYQMYDVSRSLTSDVAMRVAQILDQFIVAHNIDRLVITLYTIICREKEIDRLKYREPHDLIVWDTIHEWVVYSY